MTITAEKICKRYLRSSGSSNYFSAVNETDFTLEQGTFAVILGRSGSGKSTLLNMLAGLLVPTSGKVMYDGQDIYSMTDKELSKLRNKRTGLIPQVQSVLGSLTVIENVKLPYLMYEKRDDADAYARELLERVGIAGLTDIPAAELSGGEMRRTAIARALINKPSVIFADEPTGDLDDENTKQVFGIFRQLADSGTTVLMVTHENGAEQYADIVYRMNAGQLEMQDKQL